VVPVVPSLTRPLRILAVLSSAGNLGIDDVGRLLRDEPWAGPSRVSILDKSLSIEAIESMIRSVKPDVLYYFGHSVFRDNAGQRMRADEPSPGSFASGTRLAAALTGSGVSLAIFLGESTADAGPAGILNSLAGSAINAGVPAAIGTTKVIGADAGILFT